MTHWLVYIVVITFSRSLLPSASSIDAWMNGWSAGINEMLGSFLFWSCKLPSVLATGYNEKMRWKVPWGQKHHASRLELIVAWILWQRVWHRYWYEVTRQVLIFELCTGGVFPIGTKGYDWCSWSISWSVAKQNATNNKGHSQLTE